MIIAKNSKWCILFSFKWFELACQTFTLYCIYVQRRRKKKRTYLKHVTKNVKKGPLSVRMKWLRRACLEQPTTWMNYILNHLTLGSIRKRLFNLCNSFYAMICSVWYWVWMALLWFARAPSIFYPSCYQNTQHNTTKQMKWKRKEKKMRWQQKSRETYARDDHINTTRSPIAVFFGAKNIWLGKCSV